MLISAGLWRSLPHKEQAATNQNFSVPFKHFPSISLSPLPDHKFRSLALPSALVLLQETIYKVARLVATVKLLPDNALPSGPAGTGRAWHTEHCRAVAEAGKGT